MCQNKELDEKSPTFRFFSSRVDRHTRVAVDVVSRGVRHLNAWHSPHECMAIATRMRGNRHRT